MVINVYKTEREIRAKTKQFAKELHLILIL
jgi:hypothetical protein